ncbi:MAG: zinc ribbon domain-containing protein [Acidobacteriota bacterium]|nr:zinc ribbon domain-containing protein [Blastocatellia bacterium]MDW8411644.1 zinc ribbon domain-containing protein [Acidobacteriota bacterium]
MFCPFCGTQNREGKKFCRSCGRVLPPPKRSAVLQPVVAEQAMAVFGAGLCSESEAVVLPDTVGSEAISPSDKVKAESVSVEVQDFPGDSADSVDVDKEELSQNGDCDLEHTAQLPPSVRKRIFDDFEKQQEEELEKTAEVPVLTSSESTAPAAGSEEEPTEEVPKLSEVPKLDKLFEMDADGEPTCLSVLGSSQQQLVLPKFLTYVPQTHLGLTATEKALLAASIFTALLGIGIFFWFWILRP